LNYIKILIPFNIKLFRFSHFSIVFLNIQYLIFLAYGRKEKTREKVKTLRWWRITCWASCI